MKSGFFASLADSKHYTPPITKLVLTKESEEHKYTCMYLVFISHSFAMTTNSYMAKCEIDTFLLKYCCLLLSLYIRQTEYKLMKSIEGSTNSVNLLIPEARIIVAGRGHKQNMHNFIKMFFSTLEHWLDKLSFHIYNFSVYYIRGSCAKAWSYK